MRPKFDAFVCYARSDEEQATKLTVSLKAAGLRIWFDRWMFAEFGEGWFRTLSSGLDEAASILILVGPNGYEPPFWPQKEVPASHATRAERRNHPVIPVLLPGSDPTSIPLFYRMYRYYDLRDWSTGALEQLIRVLQPAPRTFLCHAQEDVPRVLKIFEYLKSTGVDVWLDKDRLMVGDSWRREILIAIEESDFFAICLSQTSVQKRGFVQNEIRTAVREFQLRPEGSLFLLPIRLEPMGV